MKQNNRVTASTPSRLGLGTVQFGFNYGVNNRSGQVPFREVCEILSIAAENGINFLDTSRMYGSSERVLGEAMAETVTDFILCTKLDLPDGYAEMGEAQIQEVVLDSFNRSRDALRLDTIPIYLLHNFDYYTAAGGYIWELLKEIRDRGDITDLGISIGRGPEEALACLNDEAVRVMQIPFNVLDQRWKVSGVLQKSRERDVTLINRSTYLQGLLLMDPIKAGNIVPEAPARIERLRVISRSCGVPVKELVFRYAAGHPHIDTTIIGVDTPKQLSENLAIMGKGALDADVEAMIETAFSDSPDELVNPALWNIAYAPPADENNKK